MQINYLFKFTLISYALFMSNFVCAQEEVQGSFNYLTELQDINTGFGNTALNGTSLYQQIADEFNLEYEIIGRREAEKIILNNSVLISGGLNSIGFSYKKPFVNFGVSLDRNLAPDLFDDKRWIVTDTFTIDIDASKILGNLRDQKIIDMTEENFAAFVGLVFKRKFTWIHYANSYNEGLMRHFEKLFMPFKSLSLNSISKLDPNEMIFKEDSISVKGGGLVSLPLYAGVNAMGGVLAKFQKLTKVEIVSLDGKNLQITSEKEKLSQVGISLGIQADFLKILRLTLLSYDFSYAIDSSYKVYLNISQNILETLNDENPISIEVNKILKNKTGNLETLSPFLISEEKKISKTTSHRYNFLLLGGQKTSKTQQIEISKDGHVKTFFRHYYEKIKYTEGFFAKIFTSIIFALTNSDLSAIDLVNDTKKVTIEYDSDKNLLEKREDLNIEESSLKEQKLSMTFISDFKTLKSSGKSGKKYRDRATFILERFSGVDPLAIPMVKNEELVAPFHIEGSYQVNIDGIKYLNKLSVEIVFDYLNGLCDEHPKRSFFNLRNLFDNCRKDLQNDYVDYLKDLTHDKVSADEIKKCEKMSLKYIFSPGKRRGAIKKCLSEINRLPNEEWVNIPLWTLKNFSNNIVNNSYSKVHYFNLFGVKNVFFFGSFDAMTKTKSSFTTNFHEGAFRGLGAVDNYMRLENLRAPSSVVVNQ